MAEFDVCRKGLYIGITYTYTGIIKIIKKKKKVSKMKSFKARCEVHTGIRSVSLWN